MTCCLGVGLLSIYTYRYLIGVYTDHLCLAFLDERTEDQYELNNAIALYNSYSFFLYYLNLVKARDICISP